MIDYSSRKINALEGLELNYQLTNKLKTGIMIRRSPELEKEECNIGKHLVFNKYNDIVENYYNTFNTKFSDNNNLLNKNIKDVSIKEVKTNLFQRLKNINKQTLTLGDYSSGDNKIELLVNNNDSEDEIKSVLIHELLHMSSRKNGGMIGFQQTIIHKGKQYELGTSINEGYTEKLCIEEFTHKETECYETERFLVSGIENIIGKDKMRKLYFDANLLGLINGLNNYANNLDEVSELIFKMDKLSKNYDDDLYEDSKNIIVNLYKKKLDYNKDLNLISDEEYAHKYLLGIDCYLDDEYFNPDSDIIETDDMFIIKDKYKTTRINKETDEREIEINKNI